MEVDTLNEINELSCLSPFVLGDHDKALQLLPSLRQPAAIRTLCVCCNIDSDRKLCTDVSLLHLAAFHGWMEIVNSLVSMYDCNTQCRDSWKQTPLHYAAYGGSLPVVEYFISRQHCDPNSRGEQGRTPLHYASDRGHIDLIQYLITKAGCHPGILDNNKDAAVHFASFSGRLNVVKYLIQEMNCNANSPGMLGSTPLHQACINGHVDTIKYLITEHGCDPVIKDDNGNMPIHIACLGGHLNVVKYLITEQLCDPNVKGQFGRTTLHHACDKGHLDIIRYLITEQGCDPVIKDNDGNMPIHIACLGGHFNVVKYLITEQRYDPNVKGKFGRTTLHKACNKGHQDIIRYLITEQGCDPVIKDNNGDMAIHIACLGGHFNVVKYLITEQRYDPNVKGKFGRTTLHKACNKGHLDIIRYLITEQGCDPVIKDNDGNMPIHIACLGGHLNVVKYLITEQRCDPNVKGERSRTALHYVCFNGRIDIIQYLISEQGSNPAIADDMFKTPLHMACNYGHVDVVQLLLQDRRVDVLCMDKFGKSPADYVYFSNNSYQLLKLFEPLLKSREDFPIHLFTKVVLTGNSGAGKSSLAKVIAEQDTVNFSRESDADFTRNSIDSRYRIESEVDTLTAGIDSYIVKSETIGNFVLYDLAGHSEYYFSQSVIMETVIQKTPAIFIDLVDLSKNEEEIAQAIHHWLTFIESTTSKTQEKSCVMIVGSHTDLLTEQQVITKTTLVKDLVDRRVKKQRYEGFVGMDCRVVTDKITNEFFPHLLNFHTTISAYSQPVSVYCHELYAFLQTKLEKTACQLHELVSFLTAEKDSLVPLNVPILSELLEDLSGKGVIIYLKNEQCLEKSWVVVKREIILKDVNGELFKPKYFKGFHPIASSTGIIRMSSLAELFPQYDPEMLVELMVTLEFCHPVNLAGITTNLQPIIFPSTFIKNLTNILLFFPSLLQAKRPQSLITENKRDRFGWCLGCKDYEYQFLTSRFLHILLLRLAYTFPLPSEKYTKTHNFRGIARNCSVWLNGISWNNDEGITTVVEVIQQKRWVVVTMYYNKDMTRPVEYSKHHSAVIRLVLELQKELAPDLETFECLISPSLLQTWPLDYLPESDLFPIKNVANCVLRYKPFVLSCDGSHELITQDAVPFEPYSILTPSSVCELMDSRMSDQPVSSALLNEVRKLCRQPQLESLSYLNLREYLDKMSIFTGRDPWVSTCASTCLISLILLVQVLAEVTSDDIRQSVLVESVPGECLLVSLIV